jgi:hypothetical protein
LPARSRTNDARALGARAAGIEPFQFQRDRPDDLQRVHRLILQSQEFTQALRLRYSLCGDKRCQPVFAGHAFEEADHPDQSIGWIIGFLRMWLG